MLQFTDTYLFSCCFTFYQRSGAPVPQNVNVTQKKVEATCENNLASKHSNGYAASMQENKECSEKGSEAQVSIFDN